MSEKYNIVKAASWYTIGNLLIKGVSFFILPVFTRLMDTHDYGVFSTYTADMAILETVFVCGLASTVKMAKYSDLDYKSYVSSILLIPALLSGMFAVGIHAAFSLAGIRFQMGRGLWDYLTATTLLASINLILSSKLVIDGEYKRFMAYSAIYTVGNAGISILLCYTVFRHHNVYMARVVGAFLSTGSATLFLLFQGKLARVRAAYIRQGFQWGIPLLFHGIAAVLMAQSDRILIQKYDSYDSAGIYSIAVTLSGIPAVIAASLENAWVPWFYGKLEQKGYHAARRMNDIFISLFAVVIAGFMLLSPELVKIVAHKDYWESIYSLSPLLVSVFAEMLYVLPLNVELYYKKSDKIAPLTVTAMAVNIVFDIICIINISYIAAAYVTMAARYLLFFLHCWYKKRIDPEPVMHKRTALMTSVLLIVLCAVMPTVKDVVTTRIVIMAALLIFLAKTAKENWEFVLALLRKGS